MLSMYKDSSGKIVLDITGCEEIKEVKILKMKDLGLKEFDQQMFRQLRLVEEMDISGNELGTIPGYISFPLLRRLDCSRNNINELTFVTQFPNLEELLVADNPVAFSDFCIANTLCPSLKLIDGQEFNIQALEKKMKDRIQPVISKVWNELFAPAYSASMSEAAFQALERKFRVVLGHNRVAISRLHSKYRDFMFSYLIDDFLRVVRTPSLENSPALRTRNYSKRGPTIGKRGDNSTPFTFVTTDTISDPVIWSDDPNSPPTKQASAPAKPLEMVTHQASEQDSLVINDGEFIFCDNDIEVEEFVFPVPMAEDDQVVTDSERLLVTTVTFDDNGISTGEVVTMNCDSDIVYMGHDDVSQSRAATYEMEVLASENGRETLIVRDTVPNSKTTSNTTAKSADPCSSNNDQISAASENDLSVLKPTSVSSAEVLLTSGPSFSEQSNISSREPTENMLQVMRSKSPLTQSTCAATKLMLGKCSSSPVKSFSASTKYTSDSLLPASKRLVSNPNDDCDTKQVKFWLYNSEKDAQSRVKVVTKKPPPAPAVSQPKKRGRRMVRNLSQYLVGPKPLYGWSLVDAMAKSDPEIPSKPQYCPSTSSKDTNSEPELVTPPVKTGDTKASLAFNNSFVPTVLKSAIKTNTSANRTANPELLNSNMIPTVNSVPTVAKHPEEVSITPNAQFLKKPDANSVKKYGRCITTSSAPDETDISVMPVEITDILDKTNPILIKTPTVIVQTPSVLPKTATIPTSSASGKTDIPVIPVQTTDVLDKTNLILIKTPTVSVQTPSVLAKTSTIGDQTLTIEIQTLTSAIGTPSIPVQTPSIHIQNQDIPIQNSDIPSQTQDIIAQPHDIPDLTYTALEQSAAFCVKTPAFYDENPATVNETAIFVKTNVVSDEIDSGPGDNITNSVPNDSISVQADYNLSHVDQSPVQYDSITLQKDSTLVQSDSSTVQTNDITTPDNFIPIQNDSPPIQNESPTIQNSLSTSTDFNPIPTVSTDIQNDSTLIQMNSTDIETHSIIQSDSTDIEIYSIPLHTVSTPLQTNSTPDQTYSTPVQTDSAPAQTDSTPIQTDSTLIQTNPTSVQSNSTPIQTNPTPIQTDSNPNQTDSTTNQKDSTTNQTDSTTNQTDSTPFHTDSNYTQGSNLSMQDNSALNSISGTPQSDLSYFRNSFSTKIKTIPFKHDATKSEVCVVSNPNTSDQLQNVSNSVIEGANTRCKKNDPTYKEGTFEPAKHPAQNQILQSESIFLLHSCAVLKDASSALEKARLTLDDASVALESVAPSASDVVAITENESQLSVDVIDGFQNTEKQTHTVPSTSSAPTYRKTVSPFCVSQIPTNPSLLDATVQESTSFPEKCAPNECSSAKTLLEENVNVSAVNSTINSATLGNTDVIRAENTPSPVVVYQTGLLSTLAAVACSVRPTATDHQQSLKRPIDPMTKDDDLGSTRKKKRVRFADQVDESPC